MSDNLGPNEEIVMLPLSEIIRDKSLDPRQALNEAKVRLYQRAIDRLPPMVVYRIPEKGNLLFLVSGFHRYAAHELDNRTVGKFVIRTGSWDEAQECADLANANHGIHLNRTERRGIVRRQLIRYPDHSDVWIAKDCGTTDKTVRSVRLELEQLGVIERLEKLMGEDRIFRPREVFRPGALDIDPDTGSDFEIEEEGEDDDFEPRRPPTLEERITSCQFCDHPVSTRTHLIEVARYGDTEFTVQYCTNCHELFDVIVNSVNALAAGKMNSRNLAVLEAFKQKWGVGHPTFTSLRDIACRVRDTKLSLVTGTSESFLWRFLGGNGDN